MVIRMNKNNILGHQKVGFCKVSHTYLLGSLRYKEKHAKYILISCGCMLLFTNMQFSCKHDGYGISTCDVHICPVIMLKYIFPLYYVL